MIIDGSKLDAATIVDAGLCIMGGGVAGIVIAKELSKTFKHIVLIESGGQEYNSETQSLYASSKKSSSAYPDTTHSRMRLLGGSSNHWENNTSPFDPIDFEKREWIPNSGWPIDFKTIEPYYNSAAVYCGTNSDGYNTSSWVKQLGVSDIVSNSSVLATGTAKAASPPTRFFASYGNELIDSSTVRIFVNSNIVDLEYDDATGRINKAFFESKPGVRHEVQAKVFVLCTGGIENARLLLHFNRQHNNKLGNAYDNVGRYFMDHPMVRAAHFYPHDKSKLGFYEGVRLKERVVLGFLKLSEKALRENKVSNARMPLIPATNYTISDGISSHHILMDSFSEGSIPDEFGTHILNYIKDVDMVAEAISRRSLGKKLFDHADEIEAYQLAIMVEQSPHRDNRIILSNEKDIFGVPKIEIDYEVKEEDKEGLWKILEIVAREVGAKGLGRIRLLKERSDRVWGDQMGFGHHHMGTTRMSSSSSDGVVDSNLKVYGTKNLYVAGSSVFPTGGHVPPTLTIVALCIRLAKHLQQESSYV